MKKGKLLGLVGVAVFALALSGCSSSGDGDADSAKEIKSIGITVGVVVYLKQKTIKVRP